MASRILHSISQEPPLLRWLHSHDPDRHITAHLLNASATYVSSTPPSENPFPSSHISPTAALFVPMYRRNQFILGQLYGPVSPNAIALDILAEAEHTTPPIPISRRFVVDLSFPTINFLEYEWFSDGKLSVTMHYIDSNGLYSGETILLDSPDISNPEHFARDDLLEGRNRPSPTKVVTRMRINEHPPCQICYSQGLRCTCPRTMRDTLPKSTYPSPTNWESWVAALRFTRSGLTTTSVTFTINTALGEMTGTSTLFLDQMCEVGVGQAAPHGTQLFKMFLQSAGMLVSHPGTDAAVRADEEKRDRIQLANELSKESDDWPHPETITLPQTENVVDAPDHAAQYRPDPLHERTIPPEGLSCEGPMSIASPRDSAITAGTSNDFVKSSAYSDMRGLDIAAECSDATVSPHMPQKKEPRISDIPLAKAHGNKSQGLSTQRISKRQGTLTKRRSKTRGKLLVCRDCNKAFNHKGHYNEHRLCVHEKIKEHKCAFLGCESRFFKRSDRDRHMRSKHDFTALVCSKCGLTLPDKKQLEAHMREAHKGQGKHACQKCNAAYPAASALRDHYKTCNPG